MNTQFNGKSSSSPYTPEPELGIVMNDEHQGSEHSGESSFVLKQVSISYDELMGHDDKILSGLPNNDDDTNEDGSPYVLESYATPEEHDLWLTSIKEEFKSLKEKKKSTEYTNKPAKSSSLDPHRAERKRR